MSKFKVGQRVQTWNYDDYPKQKSKQIGIVKGVNGTNYQIGGTDCSHWSEKYLTLIGPLTNTIITNITSPEQHKRVQEKLFGMGISWGGEKKVNSHPWDNFPRSDALSIENSCIGFCSTNYYESCPDYLGWTFIPASEFLGEEEKEPEELPSFVYGKSLPNTIKVNQDIVDEIYNQVFSKLRAIALPPLININNNNNPSTSPRTGKGTNIMSNIVNFAKDLLLSADEKLLRKSHLKNEYGDYTAEAEDLVRHKLLVDNEPYLLEIAKAKEADEKANK